MGGNRKKISVLLRGLAALGICLGAWSGGAAIPGAGAVGLPAATDRAGIYAQVPPSDPLQDGHPPEYVDPDAPFEAPGALYLSEPSDLENPFNFEDELSGETRAASGGSLREDSLQALLSAGSYHSCAVGVDGRIQCWGWNNFNQTDSPQGEFIQTSGGYAHTCALRPDGTIACWGLDSNGQASPPDPSLGDHYLQVSAGYAFNCALRDDGRAVCWGEDDSHQVQDTPTTITFLSVQAGAFHACGVRSSGGVRCWGLNTNGQAATPPGTFVQVAPGYRHSCGLRTNGSLLCWGDNTYGQRNAPIGTYVQVSSGDFHSCALATDGSLACWGRNNFNQITPPENGAGRFVRLEAGSWHTCAQRYDGELVCWGRDDVGQSTPPAGAFGPRRLEAGSWHNCGTGSDGSGVCWGQDLSGESSPPADIFVQVSAGGDHSCGLHPDGTLVCWGSDLQGQASPPAHNPGDFNSASLGWQFTIGALPGFGLTGWGLDDVGQASPPAITALQSRAGRSHACAIQVGGSIICWGDSSSGKTTPPAGSFAQVSAGGEHSCAISILGDLACWGDNTYGQSTPPSGRFTQVSTGDNHTCALRSDGTLSCWGDDTYGQSTPPIGEFVEVSAGASHTCGVRADNTRTCWGDNQFGQAPRLDFQLSSLPEASQGQLYSQTLTVSGGVLPYTYTLASGSLPPGINLDSGGRLSGTPSAGGSYTFTLQAADSSPVFPFSQQSQFNLGVNAAPQARRDAYTISEDSTLVVAAPGVLNNDTDPDGDPLTALLDSPPTRGSLSFNLDGSFIFTPTLNDNGNLTFTYQAFDGLAVSESQTVTISIDPENDPPYTLPDVYTGTEDTPLSIPAPGVLGNDWDVEGDPLTVTLETPPGRGSLLLAADGSFTYIPDPNDNGSLVFTYLAWDGKAFSLPGRVRLDIKPVNDAPQAAVDSYVTAEDTTLEVPAPGVLENDFDVDGDPLTARLASPPSKGRLTFGADGGFRYEPGLNFNGTLTFTYQVSDSWLSSNPVTVTLVVTPVNDAPVVEAGTGITALEGDLVAFQGWYVDPGKAPGADSILWDFGDGGTESGTLQPAHIFLEDGIYTVTLTVTDALGGVGSDWLKVQVLNASPIVEVGPDLQGKQGGVVQFQASAWDPGSLDLLTYEWDFGDGAVISGTLSPTHVYSQPGAYQVSLIVRDDDGGQTSDSLLVTVVQTEWLVWMPVVVRK